MKRVVPYWQKEGEWSQQDVFIKRVETKLPIEATEIPSTVLPRFAFLFLLEGEMLAEIDGNQYLCRGGQFLLIPEGIAFSVHHFTDLVGYTGGFSLSSLRDISYNCLTCGKPTVCTFWFDNAAFIAQIMERMTASLSRGDEGYLVRALDLILYSMEQDRTDAQIEADTGIPRDVVAGIRAQVDSMEHKRLPPIRPDDF